MQGLDEELNIEAGTEGNSEEKPKRKPFHYWTVGGVEHKMKLNTSMIIQLENKFHGNLITIVANGEVPSLGVMLTVTQAAIAPWEHKVTYNMIEKMYDTYLGEGGNMSDFYRDVILPTMAVSGFFTDSAMELILAEIQKAEMLG